MSEDKKANGALRYPDLDVQIKDVQPPRFHSPSPEDSNAYFDLEAVDRFIRFCRLLSHIKGKWAGRPVELALWQVIFVVAPLFGWKNEEGLRIYQTLYDETAKKSGKSTLGAALGLYMLTADQEPGAEVMCVAGGDREQARAVYSVAKAMTQQAPQLAKRLRPLRDEIQYLDNAGTFKVSSSKGEAKAGTNLHCGIIDELLVAKDRTLIDNVENSTAARDQPIIAYLTTAGIDEPGSIYTEKRDYAEKVAKGEIKDPTFLTAIWTLADDDDWRDEAVWKKSNPGLGQSVSLAYLRKRRDQALASPAVQNTFIRDHMNVRTGQVTRWLDVFFWDKSAARWFTPDMNRLKGKIAYMGLDLSSTTDLTALSIIVPETMQDPEDRDETVTVLNWFLKAWTPLATLDQRQKRDRAPYDQWIDAGFLTGVEGNVIDYDDVEAECYRMAEHFQLESLKFDRWGSKQLVQHLQDNGLWVREMGQGFASMTAPMKEMEKLVLQGRINHGRNPLLRWAVQSLAVKTDPAGNFKPDREKSTGRIDPFVSGVMALDAWSRDTMVESAYSQPLHASDTA